MLSNFPYMIKAGTSIFLFLLIGGFSCQPKVLSFTATPRTVIPGDSIHLAWRTKGRADLSFFYKDKIYLPPDTVPGYEFLLTATRWGKTSAPTRVQVPLVAPQHRDVLDLPLTGESGDTLIYSATKEGRYSNSEVVSLTSGRPAVVLHDGVKCALADSGKTETCLKGHPYAGDWEARLIMTPAEHQTKSKIPNDYTLIAVITEKQH